MNYKNTIIVLGIMVLGLTFVSQTNKRSEEQSFASVNGQVVFGQGDCMPCGGSNCPVRPTYPYNGTLYFVKVSDLNSLPEGATYNSLFINSPSVTVTDGAYSSATIPLGDYYALIQETYSASSRNQFTLQNAGQTTTKNLDFFACTSY